LIPGERAGPKLTYSEHVGGAGARGRRRRATSTSGGVCRLATNRRVARTPPAVSRAAWKATCLPKVQKQSPKPKRVAISLWGEAFRDSRKRGERRSCGIRGLHSQNAMAICTALVVVLGLVLAVLEAKQLLEKLAAAASTRHRRSIG